MIAAFIPLGIWGAYEYGRAAHMIYKDHMGESHYLSHLYDMRHEGTFKLFKAATLASLSNEMQGIALLITACATMIFPELFGITLGVACTISAITFAGYLLTQSFKLLACHYLASTYEEEKKLEKG